MMAEKNLIVENKKRKLMKDYVSLVISGEKERADKVLSNIFEIEKKLK